VKYDKYLRAVFDKFRSATQSCARRR
jgi:hypothetical protein